MEDFQLFGLQHLTALGVTALFSYMFFRLGSGKLSTPIGRGFGLTLILYATGFWGYKLWDGVQLELDLPLALCDITFLFCVACFFKPNPKLLTWVTYWGLGGTLQALITPDIATAFPSLEFLFFFIGHSVIVLAVFFLLGQNPHESLSGWTALKNSFNGLLVYTIIVGMLNYLADWNYGYLMEKPNGASILDFFGPWPVYVGGGLALAFCIFATLSVLLKALPGLSPTEKQALTP